MSKLVEHEEIKFFSVSDYKPILTYSGDRELFKGIEGLLCHALPQDAIEWRRSYGRGSKTVKLSAIFIPFSSDVLKLDYKHHLLKRPILHTFWTQCSDIDTYKSSLYEEIKDWLYLLNQYSIVDWVIILVETYDFRKHNKLLPRTTVLDKIKNDFCTKHADRCLSVLNPLKLDSGSSSSWRGLLVNIKLLMLSAYDDAICKLEEFIRSKRECRNDSDWSFCKYFLLQEELAFVLEMLGVYESALVQYDELDALFTQFLRNSSLTDTPKWLSAFQAPFITWYGLYLTTKVNQTLRDAIQEHSISLLDFRCYLFSRQAAMLMLNLKPWEVSQRTLPFIHNTLNELKILELNCPEGAVACWVFLCCLEVVQMCQKYNESIHVDACSYYTASLLEQCSEKLYYLGELCGLMPGCQPSSEQLHTIVSLSAGIGDSPHGCSNNYSTPTDKLKEALSSKHMFEKYYLELLEQAMVTYKHRSRIRSARLVGKKLADFYIHLGDFGKATGFLVSALLSFEEDAWPVLVVETRLQLLHCYKELGEIEKFLRLCVPVASSHQTDLSTQVSYFREMIKIVQETENEWIVPFDETFTISNVNVEVQEIGSRVVASLVIYSHLPLDLLCSNISVSIYDKKNNIKDDKIIKAKSKSESYTGHSMFFSGCVKHSSSALTRLPITQYFEYRENKSLASASVTCSHPERILRRQESQKVTKSTIPTKVIPSKALTTGSIILKSGKNNVTLISKQEESSGLYSLGQLAISVHNKLIFVSPVHHFSKYTYEVKTVQPSFEIDSKLNYRSLLLAGIEQTLIISLNMGTYVLNKDFTLKLRCSPGFRLQRSDRDEPLSEELKVVVHVDETTNKSTISLRTYADFAVYNTDNSTVQHKIWLQCPWSDPEYCLSVPFHLPFMVTHRIHSSYLRKFLLLIISGLTEVPVELKNAELSVKSEISSVLLYSLNPANSQPFVVNRERKIKLMWQLLVASNEDKTPNCLPNECNLKFSCNYAINERSDYCVYEFTLKDYTTLFTIESQVEPMKGSEFCRSNTTCHLIVTVKKVTSIKSYSLMYEVITDQTMWAVCGTSTGVLVADTDVCTVVLDIMPLINGYLPVPSVKLSKYFTNDGKHSSKGTAARRESFGSGQIYNISKCCQVHVLPSTGSSDT